MNHFHVDTLQNVHHHIQPTDRLVLLFIDINKYDTAILDDLSDQHPDTHIVGVTTSGEIGSKGLTSQTISGLAFSNKDGQAEAVFIDNAHISPMTALKKLKKQAQKAGHTLTHKQPNDVTFVFPTGLNGCEEKVVTTVNQVHDYADPLVLGATAGDDTQFNNTYVYLNGKSDTNGAVVVFMHSAHDIKAYKDVIFEPTGKTLHVTKADHTNRRVYTLNDQPASKAYASALGVSASTLSNYFMSNPVGRIAGDDVFIASPFQINSDQSIDFYCQVFEGATLHVMQNIDPVERLKQTLEQIKHDFKKVEGTLFFNCILRKIQFEQTGLIKTMGDLMNESPNACGFVSYGEQENRAQINQTLLTLVFGKGGH